MNKIKLIKKIRLVENDFSKENNEINDKVHDEKSELVALKPQGIITGSSLHIDDFLGKNFPHRTMIMSPWLRQGTLTLVYAKRGLGKTWFGLLTAVAITRGLPIFPWQTITPVGCLYLDGEMACEELQSRLRQLTIGLPPERASLHIISSEHLKSNNEPPIDLVDEKCRKNILHDLKQDKSIRLLIIDNLSCLAPRISENSKQLWDSINQWLLELRAIGVAVIMIHHTGKKDGTPRGTSAREDNIDVSISLEEANYEDEEDTSFRGVKFVAIFTKSRGLCGNDAAPLVIKIAEGYAGKLPWETCSKDEI